MFKMNKKSIEVLEGGTLNKYQMAALKRQKVYKAIKENPYISENKQLAEAAGYDMSDWASDEYKAGSAFIQNILRQGYIEKQLGKDGQEYFYVTNKEDALCDSPAKTIKSEDDYLKARCEEEKMIDELTEELVGPEGQPKADWATETIVEEKVIPCPEQYSGEFYIKSSNGNTITVTFGKKTKAEIVDMINKTNLEVI